jgi:hypothetical protein
MEDTKHKIRTEEARIRQPLFMPRTPPDPDWYLNAVVPGTWDAYAQGYKMAADNLVQHVTASHDSQDYLVNPITFLYRHYLELRLKELLLASSLLQRDDSGIQEEHGLTALWDKLRPKLETVLPGFTTDGDLEAIQDRLKEFCEKDPGSYAFRYPEKTRKTGGGPSLPNMVINLRQLSDVVHGMSIVLDSLSTAIGVYADTASDHQAEACDEHGDY